MKDFAIVRRGILMLCRVVYADDDALVRETIADLLLGWNVDVHPCRNGHEAIDLCVRLLPDAALLDLNMPECDGFETARRLRRRDDTRGIRLVALTGFATSSSQHDASIAGFDAFLTKPVATQRLVSALCPPLQS
jgi:CheY-like chemotaxis protein